MKRTLLAVLLSALVGSAFAASPTLDKNGSFTPYDRDSAAASPGQ